MKRAGRRGGTEGRGGEEETKCLNTDLLDAWSVVTTDNTITKLEKTLLGRKPPPSRAGQNFREKNS